MKFRYYILITFGVLLSNTFKGHVVDIYKKPISNANITINDATLLTDENGNFSHNYYGNEIHLNISHIGYENKKINLKNYNGDVLEIVLFETSLQLNNVVVSSLRKDMFIKDIPILTHVITSNDIKNTAYSNVKDILEMTLPNVQNVMSSHAGISNNQVKIQGLDNRYLLFMVDGTRVTGEFAGNLDFNMLTLSDVDRIEVVEGGMSSLYGSGAIGGIVNVITKRHTTPYWLNLSYLSEDPMIFSTSLNFGFNFKNLYYNFDFSGQNSDGYDLTPISNSNYTGPILKTLEEYQTESYKHSIKLHDENSSFEFKIKNYSNEIYQYRNYLGMFNGFNIYQTLNNGTPWFSDESFGLIFNQNLGDNSFKLSINSEEYRRTTHYFNYGLEDCSNFDCNSDNVVSNELTNTINKKNNLLFQFNLKQKNNDIIFGFESNDNNLSSYNIYNPSIGDYNNDGQCNTFPDDCLSESIFGALDDTKAFKEQALYIGNQTSFSEDDILFTSLRKIFSNNYDDKIIYSIALLTKNVTSDKINVRLNYSSGYKTPTIKELYYNFIGHDPPVIGNPNLLPTSNNSFSISFDKRDFNYNASLEFFYNDVKDLIASTWALDENGDDILLYDNISSIKFQGVNLHYEKIFQNKSNFKVVYNHTNPKSNSKSSQELISKNSIRMNLLTKTELKKLDISLSVKFSGEKFVYLDDEKIALEDYSMIDLIGILNLKNDIKIKFGWKNLLDYSDNRRLLDNDYESNILSSYDPGKRFVFEINLNLKGDSREN